MGWPTEYGGRGATPMQQAIAADEMARANAPAPINGLGVGFIGPTIIIHGTPEQKQRYLRKILTAEEMWCQLYSEPNSGSDLASLRTRAEDKGDHFLVNGQKIWTSGGHIADWGILLARTDPGVAKHKGISCLLFNMRQPGVEVRPLKQITGSSEFNEVFMTNARTEKRDLLGRLGQGWAIAQTTLGFERGGNSMARVTRYASAFDRLVEAATKLTRGGKPLLEDPVVRAKLGKIYADMEVQRYAALRARRHDLFGLVGDPEERHRRARARSPQGDPRRPRREGVGGHRGFFVQRRSAAPPELRARLPGRAQQAGAGAAPVGRSARRERGAVEGDGTARLARPRPAGGRRRERARPRRDGHPPGG